MKAFLLEHYVWIKSLHLIAVIAWMAGMMYLPRLFIYHFQAEKGGEAERFFVQMERRLLKGIINPSMVIVFALGVLMVVLNPDLMSQTWFQIKFVMALGIAGIHGLYARARRQFEAGDRPYSEKFWRMMNEAPFLALIVIVIMVIVKPF